MKISKTGNIKRGPINRYMNTYKEKRNYKNKCSNESDEHLIKLYVQIQVMLTPQKFGDV